MNSDQIDLRFDELDRVTTSLLVPVRAEKRVPGKALSELLALLDYYKQILSDRSIVPKKLVGNLYFIFTSMLAEADHAQEPDAILIPAWEIHEKLRKIFGPEF